MQRQPQAMAPHPVRPQPQCALASTPSWHNCVDSPWLPEPQATRHDGQLSPHLTSSWPSQQPAQCRPPSRIGSFKFFLLPSSFQVLSPLSSIVANCADWLHALIDWLADCLIIIDWLIHCSKDFLIIQSIHWSILWLLQHSKFILVSNAFRSRHFVRWRLETNFNLFIKIESCKSIMSRIVAQKYYSEWLAGCPAGQLTCLDFPITSTNCTTPHPDFPSTWNCNSYILLCIMVFLTRVDGQQWYDNIHPWYPWI